MRITDVVVGKVTVPLKKPFKTALRVVHAAEDVVVRVLTDTGATGYGSAVPTAVITGETQDSLVAAVREHYRPSLLGREVENLEGCLHALDRALVRNSSARSAVDVALHDLFAQRFAIPLHVLFGGNASTLTTDLTISMNEPEEMARDALEAVGTGYRTLKLKVGSDPERDFQRVVRVRKAVGEAVSLRLDANQGWSAKQAVRTIRRLEAEGLRLEFVEQPVAAADWDGLAFVTRSVESDIVADESVFGPRDALRTVQERAADIINIKLLKAGGFSPALKMCAIAESVGMECMMSSMLESKLGITASAALAAGRRAFTRVDLDAASLLAEDPFEGGVRFEGDAIILSAAPGLGITAVRGWKPL